MAGKTRRSQGKQEFVKTFLERNPAASGRMLNEAWKQAGNKGTISGSYFYATKGKMGLTRARPRGVSKPELQRDRSSLASPPARKPGRPPGTSSKGNGAVTSPNGRNESKSLRQTTNRGQALEELEVDIDRLMTRVMTLVDLPEVEEALRKARRLLVLANQA